VAKSNPFFLPAVDMKLGDRYLLLEQLGDGTHGWVWRAQRLDDNQIVAVKIPKDCSASDDSLKEGYDLVDVQPHKNVVQIYWMGRIPPEREWYGIEMEYFPSRSLAQLLEDQAAGFAKTYKQIFDIYGQILQGVKYLADLETPVSHGDLKPHNILVSDGLVKITDFGSSALPEEIYARSRQNGGTILYAAPEFSDCSERRGSFLELVRGDMYSLGVLMYQLVTGRTPHDTPSAVYRYVPFAKPSELNKSVSPYLESFILKALSVNPVDRWGNIDEMMKGLEKAMYAQLNFETVTGVNRVYEQEKDWSTKVIAYATDKKYLEAAHVAGAEFDSSKDYHALLSQLRALYRAERYFDCVAIINSEESCLTLVDSIGVDFRLLALNVFLKVRDIHYAEKIIQLIIGRNEMTPSVKIKYASILGLQSKYSEAIDILTVLNKEFPRKAVILRRIALAYEQNKQPKKAMSYLKAYLKIVPDDEVALKKYEGFKLFC